MDEEWTPPAATSRVTKRDVERAKTAWTECLSKHGAERELFTWEELELARSIQRFSIEAVLLAILGQAHEPGNEEYKPSRYLSLRRLFDPDKLERYVSLGAQVRRQEQERERAIAAAEVRSQAFREVRER